ncbi:hypothetical protein BKA62DRAFT_112541 [Auriculariales sp. MPI-PUGE-AT-0066]|nr:hypothetical protein BKA62DRAFT_112541 [Auriculariales sp. MPI-PUGE-AT-0066]
MTGRLCFPEQFPYSARVNGGSEATRHTLRSTAFAFPRHPQYGIFVATIQIESRPWRWSRHCTPRVDHPHHLDAPPTQTQQTMNFPSPPMAAPDSPCVLPEPATIKTVDQSVPNTYPCQPQAPCNDLERLRMQGFSAPRKIPWTSRVRLHLLDESNMTLTPFVSPSRLVCLWH